MLQYFWRDQKHVARPVDGVGGGACHTLPHCLQLHAAYLLHSGIGCRFSECCSVRTLRNAGPVQVKQPALLAVTWLAITSTLPLQRECSGSLEVFAAKVVARELIC